MSLSESQVTCFRNRQFDSKVHRDMQTTQKNQNNSEMLVTIAKKKKEDSDLAQSNSNQESVVLAQVIKY